MNVTPMDMPERMGAWVVHPESKPMPVLKASPDNAKARRVARNGWAEHVARMADKA